MPHGDYLPLIWGVNVSPKIDVPPTTNRFLHAGLLPICGWQIKQTPRANVTTPHLSCVFRTLVRNMWIKSKTHPAGTTHSTPSQTSRWVSVCLGKMTIKPFAPLSVWPRSWKSRACVCENVCVCVCTTRGFVCQQCWRLPSTSCTLSIHPADPRGDSTVRNILIVTQRAECLCHIYKIQPGESPSQGKRMRNELNYLRLAGVCVWVCVCLWIWSAPASISEFRWEHRTRNGQYCLDRNMELWCVLLLFLMLCVFIGRTEIPCSSTLIVSDALPWIDVFHIMQMRLCLGWAYRF